MLIDFKKSVQRLQMRIGNVIHVGAHWGQEYDTYKAVGAGRILFIEPCFNAFTVLKDRMKDKVDVTVIESACGSELALGHMFTEQSNRGMSNSLLRPAKHLQQHPDIVFDDQEVVQVRRLDEITHALRFTGNLLVMDVQGYELEVLKGAPDTLKSVNYIYTEVNRDEVYENCARIEELDAFLHEFTRFETKWAGNWGDAIYLRNAIHD